MTKCEGLFRKTKNVMLSHSEYVRTGSGAPCTREKQLKRQVHLMRLAMLQFSRIEECVEALAMYFDTCFDV